MSMVSVLTPCAALARDSPLCGLGIPGTLRPATAGRGSRAGDQLETSFREPMAVHPGAGLRPLRAGPTVSGRSTDDAGSRGHGNQPGVVAGSLCHYPNGKGRPGNAGVAGVPVCYAIQTMIDFRDRIARARTRAKPTPTG